VHTMPSVKSISAVIIITALACSVAFCDVLLENGQVLIRDSFDALSDNWNGFWLRENGGQGGYDLDKQKLYITLSGRNGLYGVYNRKSFSGHFYAQVEFGADRFCGLAIIQDKNGAPDVNNFTSVQVSQTNDGKTMLSVRDRQNGVDNVLDNTGKMDVNRYHHILDFAYSVPFNKTNKKFRIFRDDLAGTFHFYYAVRQFIRGQWAEGWMELAPSRDWSPKGQPFYVALLVNSDAAENAAGAFDNLLVMQKPSRDMDDTQTGFRAVRRDYNWSGFWGDALVVSFGDEFPFRAQDYKFVFWEAANDVPVWHLNNQLQFCYEFVETWGGGIEGCHEPMSDRMGRWSHVSLVEDNDVRKIVKWHYVLCNADYQVPDNSIGIDLPEVNEYYTIYRDGTILRHIEYFAKLDALFRNWHELTELIVIAGTQSGPGDHLLSPALTVMNLDGDKKSYFPDRQFDETVNNWAQVISVAHLKSAPDAFNVFSQDRNIPETFSYYPIQYDLSWHNTTFKFCHWPVGLEPYEQPCKTHGTWNSQVSHTSLIGAGVHEGQDWKAHYLTDARGRKYRQWTSLLGLAPAGSEENIRSRAASWLYPAAVKMIDQQSHFLGYDYAKQQYDITVPSASSSCEFVLTIPGDRRSETVVPIKIINPCFKLENRQESDIMIDVDGEQMEKERDFFTAPVGDDLLVWFHKTFTSPARIRISMDNSSGVREHRQTLNANGFLLVNYPNPFNGSTRIRYRAPEATRAIVTIISASGQVVKRWLQPPLRVGVSEIHWDATANSLPSGVYFIRLQAGSLELTRKALFLK